MKILHVLPDTAGDPRQRFLGSTKDLRGRTEYFRQRGFEVVEMIVPVRKDAALVKLLSSRNDLAGFQAVFIELPIYPGAIRYLSLHHPGIRVLVRAINAEFFHQIHYILSGLKHGYWKRSARYALTSFHRLYQDIACSRRAYRLLSISEWETKGYWRLIAGKGKTLTVPYFVPGEYIEKGASVPKSDICVCLQSTIMNSFLADSAVNFHKVLRGLGTGMPEWSFYMTGGNPPEPSSPLPRLIATGVLESPFELLARARAMALLSDYGLGFKTKILDAVLQKCFVLITPGLYSRLPEILRPFCIMVDPARPDSFRRALAACSQPFPVADANASLRAQAFAALDIALGTGYP
jgi:hypothetical protein